MVETRMEELKAQSTEALKALLDYAKEQKDYFIREESFKMVQRYNFIIGKLEDELGNRLETIFIFD